MPKPRLKRILFYVVSIFLVVLLSLMVWFKYATKLEEPKIADKSALNLQRIQVSNEFYKCGDSWLKKSESGLWEMYVTGAPFERGVKMGILSKELIQIQETAFVNEIRNLVPSSFLLYFLKYFLQFYNRSIDRYIPREYLEEIYGVSSFASDSFSFIGMKYERILNYHAAHDIGHALQNMKMVGCTSFSAWGDKTENGDIIVGRNFDFFVGDEFAKNKIICFMKPQKGYKFAFVTWGGMIGVVSGMNEKGLTVTINAAKSQIPGAAKTPISILVREILQYAHNIREAIEIANKHQTFVSESILIGSSEDKKTAIVEIAPENGGATVHDIGAGVFEGNDSYIICSNHFQSDLLKDTKLNRETLTESSTKYRYDRVNELLKTSFPLNYRKTAEILRNKEGLGGKNIGLGNEKAINQLIAHHSVIFEPERKLFWVSTQPFQLGKYVCYDLNKIFGQYANLSVKQEIYEPSYTIEADTFLLSERWTKFLKFKEIKKNLKQNYYQLSDATEKEFIASNPEFFDTYSALGDYYGTKKNCDNAIKYYQIALTKEIPTLQESDAITAKIVKYKENKKDR